MMAWPTGVARGKGVTGYWLGSDSDVTHLPLNLNRGGTPEQLVSSQSPATSRDGYLQQHQELTAISLAWFPEIFW